MVRQGQPVPNGSLVSERLNVLLVQNYCDEYHHCAILVYYPFPPAPPPRTHILPECRMGQERRHKQRLSKGNQQINTNLRCHGLGCNKQATLEGQGDIQNSNFMDRVIPGVSLAFYFITCAMFLRSTYLKAHLDLVWFYTPGYQLVEIRNYLKNMERWTCLT